MRLKSGQYEYKIPSETLDIRGANLTIGRINYALKYVKHMDILHMRREHGKIFGVPEYVSLLVDKDGTWLVLHPIPEKAWKLQIYFAKMDVL